ncbi:MAG: hypothetical protein ACOH18_01690 [Candidatus Saccharimonadaceae bacterium]
MATRSQTELLSIKLPRNFQVEGRSVKLPTNNSTIEFSLVGTTRSAIRTSLARIVPKLTGWLGPVKVKTVIVSEALFMQFHGIPIIFS